MVSLYVRYMSEKSKEEEKIATESQRHRERRKAEKKGKYGKYGSLHQ